MKDIKNETLQFPLTWHGRLVVEGEESETKTRIEQVMHGCGHHDFTLAEGKTSSQGRFRSWQISVVIPNILSFRATTTALGSLPGVRMLL